MIRLRTMFSRRSKWMVLLISVWIGINACQKENFVQDPDFRLEFSSDTLRFDTVFTSLGSATRTLKVFNHSPDPVQISGISLLSGNNSSFRLNVDGTPGNLIRNVEIAGRDSLYIFAEVTVDPDNPVSHSPFIISEFLLFEVNGNEQQVLLEAWGQNANYIPGRNAGGTVNLLSCNSGSLNWDDPKPYVIYGVLFIDSCELVLPPGTELYVHGGVARQEETVYNDGLIIVLPDGKINAKGELDNPVTIQGDRLESSFSDTPGQWSGIRFSSGSKGNSLEHTWIKNSQVGIRMDSASSISLKSVKIYQTSGSGLIGIQSTIYAENSLFHSNGNYGAVLTYGGNYNFYYCTIANYGNQASAIRMDNFQCADPLCSGEVFVNKLKARFTNCIFSGSSEDEIELADALGGEDLTYFDYAFDHCLVRVDELLSANQFPNFFDQCTECINSKQTDILFKDIDNSDYSLDTMSVAEMRGIPVSFINYDIEGNQRDQISPDPGCFEFQN